MSFLGEILHIFRKDTRYLRFEIALFGLMALVFAGMELYSKMAFAVEILLVLSGMLLTGRMIHAEAIAGQGQFWITRPYRWRCLLLAKVLFLAVWIDIPLGVARLIELAVLGYPLGSSLPALVWSQIVMLGAVLTIAAAAALTPGIMPFCVAMLVLRTPGL